MHGFNLSVMGAGGSYCWGDYMRRLAVAAVALMSMTTVANATIVNGSFSGLASGVEVNNMFGLGWPGAWFSGVPVTGTFSYDSAALTNSWNVGGTYGGATTYSPTVPLTITETINGSSITVTGNYISSVRVYQIDNSSNLRNFTAFEISAVAGEDMSSYMSLSMAAINSNTNLLTNINDVGTANFSDITGDKYNLQGSTQLPNGTAFKVAVTSMSARPDPSQIATVPIPTALPMFASGLIALGALGRRLTKKA